MSKTTKISQLLLNMKPTWILVILIVIEIFVMLSQSELAQNMSSYFFAYIRAYLSRGRACTAVQNNMSLCTLRDGKSFYTYDNDIIVSDIIRSGFPWEEFMHKYFKRYGDKGKIAVDIGANIGAHTVYLSELFKEVHAFEPQKSVYKLLQLNIKQNRADNVQLYNVGLGEKNEVVFLKQFDIHHKANQGAIKIIDAEDVDHRGEMINVKRLDDYHLDNVGLMKIDVEGYEYHVLRGAFRTIATYRPVILIELYQSNQYNREIREFFERLGYTLHHINYADYLAEPN
jgi:FkbM family methyltransferase